MTIASIIIPTHNRDHLLARAVNSALGQSREDIEVIVIDDASTDQTDEVLEIFLQMDSRLKVITLPAALGLSGGLQRNEGIKMAEGKYVCYLDDDDVMTPNAVADRVNFLEEHPELDFCWGRTMFIRNNVNHPEFDDLVTTRLVAKPAGPEVHWAIGTIIPNDFMHRAGVVGGEKGVWWVSGRGEDRRLLMDLVAAEFKGGPVDAVVSIYGRTGPFVSQRVPKSKIRKARKEAAERARLLAAETPVEKRPVAAPVRLPAGYSARLQARSKARSLRALKAQEIE